MLTGILVSFSVLIMYGMAMFKAIGELLLQISIQTIFRATDVKGDI